MRKIANYHWDKQERGWYCNGTTCGTLFGLGHSPKCEYRSKGNMKIAKGNMMKVIEEALYRQENVTRGFGKYTISATLYDREDFGVTGIRLTWAAS